MTIPEPQPQMAGAEMATDTGELQALAGRYGEVRLAFFKAQLRAMIHYVSPVAADALEREGLSVQDAIERISPPGDWPHRGLQTSNPFGSGNFRFRNANDHSNQVTGRRFERLIEAAVGFIMPSKGGDRGRLAFRVSAHTLEIAMISRDFFLATEAGKGCLQLSVKLPLTMGSRMLDRPVGDIVSHPLLDGRNYPVTRVKQPVDEALTTIGFDTGHTRLVADSPNCICSSDDPLTGPGMKARSSFVENVWLVIQYIGSGDQAAPAAADVIRSSGRR
ncbi:hypothetical protein E5673_14740 [Sphingomonas sp. PAMC26645]|uniref:hypothetical protein n=1 Tax=Sphingomonas sp. PAMC26645 TaxID=2565555 RepID=UPI00109DC499|nr:hypothetical protein [Sphingomonas sp. PAMC26645]QCB43326.1 hypothetical protein E5673_14740 [Sphingomonas sp. PAMC26645]